MLSNFVRLRLSVFSAENRAHTLQLIGLRILAIRTQYISGLSNERQNQKNTHDIVVEYADIGPLISSPHSLGVL